MIRDLISLPFHLLIRLVWGTILFVIFFTVVMIGTKR